VREEEQRQAISIPEPRGLHARDRDGRYREEFKLAFERPTDRVVGRNVGQKSPNSPRLSRDLVH
jgi:hypothetical protein